jgi:hypothetical protein
MTTIEEHGREGVLRIEHIDAYLHEAGVYLLLRGEY